MWQRINDSSGGKMAETQTQRIFFPMALNASVGRSGGKK
jgi:hypothetical protein